jgi:hypothetical protein
MPSKPPPRRTWPRDALGSVIIKKLTSAGMNSTLFNGKEILTWLKTPKGVDKFLTLTIRAKTRYPASRVRKFVEGAGISPEKWMKL